MRLIYFPGNRLTSRYVRSAGLSANKLASLRDLSSLGAVFGDAATTQASSANCSVESAFPKAAFMFACETLEGAT